MASWWAVSIRVWGLNSKSVQHSNRNSDGNSRGNGKNTVLTAAILWMKEILHHFIYPIPQNGKSMVSEGGARSLHPLSKLVCSVPRTLEP